MGKMLLVSCQPSLVQDQSHGAACCSVDVVAVVVTVVAVVVVVVVVVIVVVVMVVLIVAVVAVAPWLMTPYSLMMIPTRPSAPSLTTVT